MIYAAFDVKANGLINSDIDDPVYQPEIIEFGAVKWVTDNIGELSVLIKPENALQKEVIKITKITDKMLKDEKPFPAVFPEISAFFTGVDILVTFNGEGYDLPVLMYNLRKYGLQYNFPWPRKHIDLMVAATDYLGMKGKTGNKPPKLVELHKALFDKEFDDAHRALEDAKATAECFKVLQKRRII